MVGCSVCFFVCACRCSRCSREKRFTAPICLTNTPPLSPLDALHNPSRPLACAGLTLPVPCQERIAHPGRGGEQKADLEQLSLHVCFFFPRSLLRLLGNVFYRLAINSCRSVCAFRVRMRCVDLLHSQEKLTRAAFLDVAASTCARGSDVRSADCAESASTYIPTFLCMRVSRCVVDVVCWREVDTPEGMGPGPIGMRLPTASFFCPPRPRGVERRRRAGFSPLGVCGQMIIAHAPALSCIV